MPVFSARFINWTIFVLLCLIWGSSFILMKWGMFATGQQMVLSPYQVAALRMLTSGLVMLPLAFRALKGLSGATIRYVLLTGWIGSFFPAFLFCIAETRIDGALTGSLNSLTPLFVAITGALFFNIRTSFQKLLGVVVGLTGSGLLLLANISHPPEQLSYAGFVIIATILYGLNVNMVYSRLKHVRSIQIAAIAFTGLIPPSILVLWFSGYFSLPLHNEAILFSTAASSILGILGTAIASILFYVLVKRSGGLFASLVTYGIPFVAIGWGFYYGERFTFMQMIALLIILFGVYLANRQPKKPETGAAESVQKN